MSGHTTKVAALLDRDGDPIASIPMREVAAPRVGICVPSGDMVHKAFAASLFALGKMSGAQAGASDIPVVFIGVEGSLVARNRNDCIDYAKQFELDYVLFLDSDMKFPHYTLRRLLGHEKDIVGATYVTRNAPHRLLGVWEPGTEVKSSELTKVHALPAGCLLIKMSVFDRLTAPYFRTPAFEADEHGPARIQGEDYYFCESAERAGFDVWLDAGLSLQLGHVGTMVHSIQLEQPAEPMQEAA